MKKEKLIERLNNAWVDTNGVDYKDTDREYEKALTILISQNFDSQDENNAKEFLAYFNDQTNSSVDEKIAYSAFFALVTYYRHKYDYENLKYIWDTYNKLFEKFDSYNHLVILYILFNIEEIKNLDDIDRYMEIAKNNISFKNSKTGKDNPGFDHAVADLYACICEKYENSDIFNQIKENWNDFSIKCAEQSIALEPDAAVFYNTYGRILSINNKYELADEQFASAIKKEKSSSTW